MTGRDGQEGRKRKRGTGIGWFGTEGWITGMIGMVGRLGHSEQGNYNISKIPGDTTVKIISDYIPKNSFKLCPLRVCITKNEKTNKYRYKILVRVFSIFSQCDYTWKCT